MADRFRVKRLLGVGGMGQVFEASDERLERTIALKILLGEHLGSAKARQRFEREAKVIARVRHPNVIEIFDYFPYGDDLVLALEYLSGGTLADRIGRGLAVTEVVRMGRGLLAGLGAIHKAGLVHRDIKPANVLLTADDEPKIADLGIAHDSVGRSMTRTGARMGTPEYMSPEQISGEKIDARTDIYACGILFYEALTGEVPFQGNSEFQVQEKHIHQPVDTARLAAKAPPGFVAMVEKALAKLPDARWQSAEQMAKALTDGPTGGGEVRDRAREAQEGAVRAVEQPQLPPFQPLPQPVRKRISTVVVIAVVVAALVGMIALMVGMSKKPSAPEQATQVASRGMGTTCVVAFVQKGALYLGHVGDSRAYVVRGGVAKQETVDQTKVQRMLEANILTEEEAKPNPS